ncbi:MAG: ribonuclease Z [Nanoarchaeota archaeon]
MKITILGSGTFVPFAKRTCSSHLLEDNKNKIMFDFGSGTINYLTKLGIKLYGLNHIFISHMHADHSSDLSHFILFILDAPDKNKLKEKYFIYGPEGINRDIENMLKAFHLDDHKNLNRLKIIELNKEIKIGSFRISPFLVSHDIMALAYRIEYFQKALCYSGDSSYCEGLKEACMNTDLAIIEATFPKHCNLRNHLSGEELGKLAQETKIKKLIVTHVADTYLPQVKKDIKKNYKGKIIIAKDLMRFKI